MTVRPKIKEIAENTEKFKLSTFHVGDNYKNYIFVFKEIRLRISTYSLTFYNDASLYFSSNIIDLKREEEKFLLKAFKQKIKKWKKENSNVENFCLEREIQQNDLLNKINFNKEE